MHVYLTDEEGSGILAIKKPANVFWFWFCFVAVVIRTFVVFVCLFFALLSFTFFFSLYSKRWNQQGRFEEIIYVFFLPHLRLVVIYYCAL